MPKCIDYTGVKGSHSANKKTKFWIQQKSKVGTEGTLVWEHRTVRCTPDSVRCATGQCPVHQRTPTQTRYLREFSRGDSAIIHRTVRCTPDSVRCSKERRLRNSPASGNCNGCSAIIHRTCPVYTGLSGVTAGQRLPAAHLLRTSARRSQACPYWRTGHSIVHVRCATGHPGGPNSQSSNGRNPTVW